LNQEGYLSQFITDIIGERIRRTETLSLSYTHHFLISFPHFEAMAKQLLLLLLLFIVHGVESAPPPHSCDPSNPTTKLYQFCRTDLPIGKRARDLVSRLTIDEKISQLVNTAPGIPRLGVPAYEWWSEALHGVAYAGPGIRFNGTVKAATSFPQVILTAASFDSYEWFRIAQVRFFLSLSLCFFSCLINLFNNLS